MERAAWVEAAETVIQGASRTASDIRRTKKRPNVDVGAGERRGGAGLVYSLIDASYDQHLGLIPR